ncbi:LytTR family DNA-binding domain-containing protein [Fuscovulum blasticum]|uniref:LytTR family DNA-binding domain-containing protein n=1 Tax=Fuscovulum blasticum TaxID=1075 RepID=UPI000D3E9454|nr:LytTR family DNA-binding domain-containing protein [Fuscovulum blasticum]AWD22153.1 hypothetical protein B6K69_11070 [Fuscovulum blasticum]
MKTQVEPIIAFASGETAPLCSAFVWELVGSTRFKLFIVTTIGLFALIQPYQPVKLQRWEAITIIAVVGLMVFFCYVSAFMFFAKCWRRFRLRQLRTIWLLLISSLMASFAGQWALPLFGETPKTVLETLLVWVFHFMMFTGLEIIFSTFVLPEVMANLARRPGPHDNEPIAVPVGIATATVAPAPAAAPARIAAPRPAAPIPAATATVIISDKRFEIDKIKWVMAEEHYISIYTFDEQTHFMRGRLRDFLAQVSEDMGFAIHRSYWVSWGAIRQVDAEKDSMTVVLDDKTSLPVARARRSQFGEAQKRHGMA